MNMNMIKRWLVLMVIAGLPFIFSACDVDSNNVEDPLVQLNKDIALIDSYLASKGIEAVKEPNGVRMVIDVLGTKLPAKSVATTIDIDYVGKLFSNGLVFDQGDNKKFLLSDLIAGWKIAFTQLPAGSVATLYIPSYWAYGSSGRGDIPGNAILVFDVGFNEAVVTTAELEKLKSDTTAIDTYLTDKGINAVKDTSGIRYVITEPGSGAKATWYDKLTAKFTYKAISDDTKTLITVDQKPSATFYSRPVDYANGLKVGLQKLSKGGKATFYIPSGLGFGTTGAFSAGVNVIPANTNIIVEVELTDITQ
jgi:FKBP-type peptidyl-prolyl cis-trans isomerase